MNALFRRVGTIFSSQACRLARIKSSPVHFSRLPPASKGAAGTELEILSFPARMKAVQWLSPEAARLIRLFDRAASFNASCGGES